MSRPFLVPRSAREPRTTLRPPTHALVPVSAPITPDGGVSMDALVRLDEHLSGDVPEIAVALSAQRLSTVRHG